MTGGPAIAVEGLVKRYGGRTVVELAKGVLAHTTGVDMAAAYRLLVERALDNGTTLTETAGDVLNQAQPRD